MYFEDLTLLHYHSGPFDAANWQTPLLAIGWLEQPHPYPTGPEQSALGTKIQSMVALAKTSQAHVNFRGLHHCSLCKANDHHENPLIDSDINLIIPSVSVVYVAPAGIMHYIRCHSYRPPDAFTAAIDGCPEYGTSAFFQALRAANQGREIPLRSREEEYRATHAMLSKAVEARQQHRL